MRGFVSILQGHAMVWNVSFRVFVDHKNWVYYNNSNYDNNYT